MKAVPLGKEERYYAASQWQLMWRKFKRHGLARFGGSALVVLYCLAVFADFISPYDVNARAIQYRYCPPQRIHCFGNGGWRPFVCGLKRETDPVTWRMTYVEDTEKLHPIRFFVRGHRYRFLGVVPANLHLFGVAEGTIFLFGTDDMGRDLFSRTINGARVSLFVGLVGVALSFVLGVVIGGISGYFGGGADMIIQRVIEFLMSIPTVPLWMALSAALPPHWSPVKVFLGISVILSLVGWCGIARVVRGKFLELRQEDFVLAAKIAGASDTTIIFRHLLPSFLSYLIVQLTLAVPGMILGETALSFLGLGIRPPAVSWGTLLKGAQNVNAVALYPWLLLPSVFVVVTVLAYNFVGDGVRDAADPYK